MRLFDTHCHIADPKFDEDRPAVIARLQEAVAVRTGQARLADAVRAIHTAFGLDADQTEAVVYGGTGR